MRGWFDEYDDPPDEPAPPVRPALSPKCEAGECPDCPGWWWTVAKEVAVSCEHPCHAPAPAAGPRRSAVVDELEREALVALFEQADGLL
jgi:hypothetical protein